MIDLILMEAGLIRLSRKISTSDKMIKVLQGHLRGGLMTRM